MEQSTGAREDLLCTVLVCLCVTIEGDAKDTKCVLVTHELGNNVRGLGGLREIFRNCNITT